MATANEKKQRLLIQDILSSAEVFSRTVSILKAEYFSKDLQPVIRYVIEYYTSYNAAPAFDLIDAECDVLLEPTVVTRDRIISTCDSVESFCREEAVKAAIFSSLEPIEQGDMGKVLTMISEAVQISLQKDLGIDVFDDVENRMTAQLDSFSPIPTMIAGIDNPLDGGLVPTTFTLISANSGGGKSVMLSNIGRNYTLQNKDVLYISLELKAELVFLRMTSIFTGYRAKSWRDNIVDIAHGMEMIGSDENTGSFIVKRMPQHSTALDYRSYLSYYEMEYGKMPDVLLLDYIDLGDPNGAIGNMGVFEQDKRKSEEFVEILQDFNMIGLSASQQNREALRMSSPDQTVIAGGISKVNTVDNYISLYMDDTMRLQGEMNVYFLKTRSSSGVGTMSTLHFNDENLRITDSKESNRIGVMPTRNKDAPEHPDIKEILDKMDELNTPDDTTTDESQPTEPSIEEKADDAQDEFTDLMTMLESPSEPVQECRNSVQLATSTVPAPRTTVTATVVDTLLSTVSI